MTPLDLSRVHGEPAAERLAVAIDEIARQDSGRIAVAADAGSPKRRAVSYADLAQGVSAVASALAVTKPVGVVVRARRVESLVAVAAACGRQGVSAALVPDDARDLVGELRDWLVVDDSLAVSPGGRQRDALDSGPPHVVVATSGTSGPPKLVKRTWDAVLAAARLAEELGRPELWG